MLIGNGFWKEILGFYAECSIGIAVFGRKTAGMLMWITNAKGKKGSSRDFCLNLNCLFPKRLIDIWKRKKMGTGGMKTYFPLRQLYGF